MIEVYKIKPFEHPHISDLLDRRLRYSTHIYNILLNLGQYSKTSENTMFLSDEIEHHKFFIEQIDAELSSLSAQKSV